MINHARTLLLNAKGPRLPADTGETYIPPFEPVALDSLLSLADAALFPEAAGGLSRRYRVDQLLRAIHATEFSDYLRVFDSRITYDVASPVFADESMSDRCESTTPAISLIPVRNPEEAQTAAELRFAVRVSGEVATDAGGQQTCDLEISDPWGGTTLLPATVLSEGRSRLLPLPGTAHKFYFVMNYPIYTSIVPRGEPAGNYRYVYADASRHAMPRLLSTPETAAMPSDVRLEVLETGASEWTVIDSGSLSVFTDMDEADAGYYLLDPDGRSGYYRWRIGFYFPLGANPDRDFTAVRLVQRPRVHASATLVFAVRPAGSMLEMLQRVTELPGGVVDRVFGRPVLGRSKTYRALFDRHPVAVYRLAGFVLAYLARLDELHQARGT